MKQITTLSNFFNIIGVLLMIGFVIHLGADYYTYDSAVNSAPFHVFVFSNVVLYLIPSIACFIAAVYFKKRNSSN